MSKAVTAEEAFDEYLKLNSEGRQRHKLAIGYKEEEWLAFQEVWNRYANPQIPAHSKSEFKRRTALGDPNVAPPTESNPWREAALAFERRAMRGETNLRRIQQVTEDQSGALAKLVNYIASCESREPCPDGNDRPDESCHNRDQCWEPCGKLGKSEEHTKVLVERKGRVK